MKKLYALLLAFVMLFTISSAYAGLPDITGLSLTELDTLRKNISKEILSRSQWGEVTVKAGFYVVGEDIPAGHWTITCPKEYSIVEYFSKTDETGRNADIFDGAYYSANMGAPGNQLESLYSLQEIDLELKEGYYVSIMLSPVVFKPFTGRQSPFFQ